MIYIFFKRNNTGQLLVFLANDAIDRGETDTGNAL
jgi:hypothetical protein